MGGYFLWPGFRAAAQESVHSARVDNVIFVYLSGGISQADTFDLKEGSWMPGSFAPEDFGGVRWPRALLPKLSSELSSIALVRSVQAWAEDHTLSRKWLQIGRNPTRPDSNSSPHIGSIVASELTAKQQDPLFPAYVSLNAIAGNQPDAGFLPATYTPLMVADVNGESPNWTKHPDGLSRYQARMNLLTAMTSNFPGRTSEEISSNQGVANRLVNDNRVDLAFKLSTADRTNYGDSTFGNACLVARNLLRQKLGPRFVQITSGDWDHHGQIYNPKALDANEPTSMARRLDSGLAALIGDLRRDGLLDRTLILAMSEFGRTVGNLSNSGGRDHLRVQSVLFAGGGIRGGRAIGSTNALGDVIEDSGWRWKRAIRHEDIEATLYWALGIDWTKSIENPATGGRYLYVPGSDQEEYAPITELWDSA